MATVQGAHSLGPAASRNTRPVTFPDGTPLYGPPVVDAGDSEDRRRGVDPARAVVVRSSQLLPAAATATTTERRRAPGRPIAGQQHDQRPRGAENSERR